jgi:hypothetical protein
MKHGGGFAMAAYQDQLNKLVNIVIRLKEGGNRDNHRKLSKELSVLSNNWQELQKNNLLTFPEYTQLIEKKYHLSESMKLLQ